MKIRSAKAVGAAIKQRRRELGIDQSTLAKRIGASRQWVIAVEQGKDSAEIGRVLRALDALGLIVTIAGGAVGQTSSGERTVLAKIDIDAIVAKALTRRPPQKQARAAK